MVSPTTAKTRPVLFCLVLIMWLAAFLQGGPLAFAGDQLGKMTVSHCSKTLCVKVITDRGYQSPLDPQVTSFDAGELEIHSPHSSEPKTVLQFEEGYIDLESRILVTKGLKNSRFQDALLRLESGDLQYF